MAERRRLPFSWVSAAARWAKHMPDRMLHDVRRERARRRASDTVRSVLFLCLGNICRSPYAAEALRRIMPGFPVESAGLIGPGRSAPALAIGAARERGIDLTGHTSRVLSVELAQGVDLVLVMSRNQASAVRRLGIPGSRILILGDFDPEPIRMRTIPDPYDRESKAYEESYERIDRCVAALAEAIGRRR